MTLTVPRAQLFSLSASNVAYNRYLLGAQFFYIPPMQKKAGEGEGDAVVWERYSDLLIGWIIKVVLDHVGIGEECLILPLIILFPCVVSRN